MVAGKRASRIKWESSKGKKFPDNSFAGVLPNGNKIIIGNAVTSKLVVQSGGKVVMKK